MLCALRRRGRGAAKGSRPGPRHTGGGRAAARRARLCADVAGVGGRRGRDDGAEPCGAATGARPAWSARSSTRCVSRTLPAPEGPPRARALAILQNFQDNLRRADAMAVVGTLLAEQRRHPELLDDLPPSPGRAAPGVAAAGTGGRHRDRGTAVVGRPRGAGQHADRLVLRALPGYLRNTRRLARPDPAPGLARAAPTEGLESLAASARFLHGVLRSSHFFARILTRTGRAAGGARPACDGASPSRPASAADNPARCQPRTCRAGRRRPARSR